MPPVEVLVAPNKSAREANPMAMFESPSLAIGAGNNDDTDSNKEPLPPSSPTISDTEQIASLPKAHGECDSDADAAAMSDDSSSEPTVDTASKMQTESKEQKRTLVPFTNGSGEHQYISIEQKRMLVPIANGSCEYQAISIVTCLGKCSIQVVLASINSDSDLHVQMMFSTVRL